MMTYLTTILITFFLAIPAMSVELFRYRGAAKDGGTLEYVFEAGEQNSPNAITKVKATEIATDFMTTFYHEQVGALETQEFRTAPVPFWLVCFSDTVIGPPATNVLCRAAGGRDCCCAKSGEATVGVVKTRLEFAAPRVGVPQSDSAERLDLWALPAQASLLSRDLSARGQGRSHCLRPCISILTFTSASDSP